MQTTTKKVQLLNFLNDDERSQLGIEKKRIPNDNVKLGFLKKMFRDLFSKKPIYC